MDKPIPDSGIVEGGSPSVRLSTIPKPKMVISKTIFWFFRVEDGEPIAIDDEKAAWKMYRDRGRTGFHYLGRSNGRIYYDAVRNIAKLTKEEHVKMVQSGEQAEDKSKLVREALAQELAAVTDRTPPRNFDVMDLDGQPLQDPMVRGFLGKI